MLRPLAAAADRRESGEALHKRARSAPADQVTETVPPVVKVCVPPSLLLFTMSIVAQVAAAGTAGRASGGSGLGERRVRLGASGSSAWAGATSTWGEYGGQLRVAVAAAVAVLGYRTRDQRELCRVCGAGAPYELRDRRPEEGRRRA